jgi:hypothetical protein
MSAVEALKAARAAGVGIALEGEDLMLEASAPPPAAVLDALSRHKADIIALLRAAALDRLLHEEGTSRQPERITAATETMGVPWAEWKAAALNRLFKEQGVFGQPGHITAATVRHGEIGPQRSSAKVATVSDANVWTSCGVPAHETAHTALCLSAVDSAGTDEQPMSRAEATK